MAGLYVGTSGWNYPEWRDGFYAGVPRRRWLERYAERFAALEVNATFYRTIKRETLIGWHERTPASFRFAIKGHRVVTHMRRLAQVADALERQKTDLAPLSAKVAVVLWQTPARFPKDLDRLEAFARLLAGWSGPRHVLEFRDPSWFDDETAACLGAHRLGSAISDAARWPRWDALTTDLAYLRLHGRPTTYASAYAGAALVGWAERVRAWLGEGREVHVYFDNTMQGAAPDDAWRLMRMIGARDA